MRKIIAATFLLVSISKPVFAIGINMNDIYRSMLKEDFNGTLPTLNNSQNETDFFAIENTEEDKEENILTSKTEIFAQPPAKAVPEEIAEYANPKPVKEWKDIVISAQKGNLSPFDLAEINKRAEQNDKEAIEILAWITANGIGCTQDLQKAMDLYKKAANMGVVNAEKNIAAIWKAMSSYEKETMSPF